VAGATGIGPPGCPPLAASIFGRVMRYVGKTTIHSSTPARNHPIGWVEAIPGTRDRWAPRFELSIAIHNDDPTTSKAMMSSTVSPFRLVAETST
jgi:hypothetical protein